MKISNSVFLSSVAFASHYRGGTYKLSQQPDNKINIVTTQTWRIGADLYSGGCQQSDVNNQVQSDSYISAGCTSGSCQSANLKYTALFVNTGHNYCYGDGSNTIAKPTGPYRFGWSSCCWVPLTDDNGSTYSGGYMTQYMRVNDVDNNTPTFKLPPLWLIMAGCPSQKIDLAPVDSDGDKVRCRWANSGEAGGVVYNASRQSSLSLDTENCIVKYDGTKDRSTVGVKPVALMMEDFDAQGNVRSSVPVQFLAQVWTPNMSTRSIGYHNYPDWFGMHEDEDNHKDNFPVRGRRSVPSYCNAEPVFVAPTPADGSNIDGSSGSVSFTLKAKSDNGPIVGFSYQAPLGLSCTTVNTHGSVDCSWTLTADQLKVEQHSFCYDATDNLGLVTERRCLNIAGRGNTITNVLEMATELLDGSGANGFQTADGIDYGCAGRGTYDAFSATEGQQVDATDKAFYTWKKCIQCATGNDSSSIKPYDYDKDSNSCGKLKIFDISLFDLDY